jgi:hypothetical protein
MNSGATNSTRASFHPETMPLRKGDYFRSIKFGQIGRGGNNGKPEHWKLLLQKHAACEEVQRREWWLWFSISVQRFRVLQKRHHVWFCFQYVQK